MEETRTTLERIQQAARVEFLEKGFQGASLRNIVKAAGVTTGAFYGYYKSKEELFESLVGEHYRYLLGRFKEAQEEFAALPREQQPEVLGEVSGLCMFDILHYMIDEMVEIEAESTHAYQKVLEQLGHPSPPIDLRLEHILITGMFHTFFELVIHEMPLSDAENYVRAMRAFYTAGWMKIMGQ